MTTRPQISRAAAGTTIAIFAILVLAADQFTKFLALQNLETEVATPVLGDFLQFYLTFNPGAAFSLGEGVTWIFTIVLAIAALTVMVLGVTRVHSLRWALVLGALLGGVSGNLTDRLFRDPGFPVGHVVDFIYTPWMMPAIYNVADIFIVCSMVLVALLILLGVNFDGTRDKPEPAAETAVGELSEADRYESRGERRARLETESEASEDKPAASA
ncbi:signal peptidase II [Microbacterium mitrae]|uniref:signal peptidase II n=1 Tax=Microbacterium mitrae TaxID=664640 RepID=UPI001FE262E7|nr:signal peptidase II [Microbacterium mitrae]